MPDCVTLAARNGRFPISVFDGANAAPGSPFARGRTECVTARVEPGTGDGEANAGET